MLDVQVHVNQTPVDVNVNRAVIDVQVRGLGARGLPGAPGVAGGTYTHDQVLASTTWTVVHSLGFFPNVTTVDTAGTVINGGVHYDSNLQLTVTFTTAQSGQAYVS